MLETGFLHTFSRQAFSGSLAKTYTSRLTNALWLGLILCLYLSAGAQILPGATSLVIYGDLKVDESHATGIKPLNFDVILYSQGGVRIDRQPVSNGGRYRFSVSQGTYDIAVEVDSVEVAKVRVEMLSPLVTSVRKDIELEWKGKPSGADRKPQAISATDLYKRNSANEKLFNNAEQALDGKNYKQAVDLFVRILSTEPNDFQTLTELGTTYLLLNDTENSEKNYKKAIEVHPDYALALIDLGRVRLMTKNLDGAIEALTHAVEVQPTSPEANFYLGEAYLQNKKGSKAVGYLNEALRLSPIGMAQAHLRLAALYNGAGLKDKAATEYEEFLKKKPDYSEKSKLEAYIAANKKTN